MRNWKLMVVVLALVAFVGQGIVPTFVIAGMSPPSVEEAAIEAGEYACEDDGGMIGDPDYHSEGGGSYGVFAQCANGNSAYIEFHCPGCIQM